MTDTDFDTLAEAFARAFAGYDTQWNPEELRRMLRRRGIGSGLLARAAEASRTGAVKVINTESRCPSIAGFLAARNIPRAGRQFEMVRKL